MAGSGHRFVVTAFLFVGLLNLSEAMADPDWAARRAAMIREIEADVMYTASYINKRALDKRVLEAMGQVPRHEFVPASQQRYAYENRPLPIGYGQTISQPYIVALMTDLVSPEPHHRVLEVGTGSGYQAAVLSQLVSSVYTIEIIPELGEAAGQRLEKLGYGNVTMRTGDGYYGWENAAPFDAIVVTAAADHIPPPLVRQLKPGGHMVIPVGGRFTTQELVLVSKDRGGEINLRQLLPVAFVPLTGGH